MNLILYHHTPERGQVHNRILSVGSARRARALATLLQPLEDGTKSSTKSTPLIIESSRGFLTVTGRYKTTPVSIICTHMGMANMDFVLRECAHVVDGPMAVIRLGTCGGLHAHVDIGTVVVSSGGSVFVRYGVLIVCFSVGMVCCAVCLYDQCRRQAQMYPFPYRREPDAFAQHAQHDGSNTPRPYYSITLPVPADPLLSTILLHALQRQSVPTDDGGDGTLGGTMGDAMRGTMGNTISSLGSTLGGLANTLVVTEGMNASADSFYSSQGRPSHNFIDHNEHVLTDLLTKYPQTLTMEMETFHLFDLARCSMGRVCR